MTTWFGSSGPRVGVCLGILLLASCGTPLLAQSLDQVHISPTISSPSRVTRPGDYIRPGIRPLRADVDVVLVPAVVTDSLNRPVLTLQKHNFTVYDCNEAQEIKYFSQEDAPISIGILLDTSGSMRNKYDLAREAVSEFFANANRDDDYFVITFGGRPELLADTTQSPETIERDLENIFPSGGTPLLDAIYLGLAKLKHARYERRALLIISDGGDNESRYRSKEIRSLAQESDAQIYAMGISSPFSIAVEDWTGKKLLSNITDATGGRAVFLSSARKLPEVSAEFSRELRSRYVLGYQPKDIKRDGKIHKITLKLNSDLPHPVQMYYKREYIAFR